MSRIRYFDVDEQRPGLSTDVAALIDQIQIGHDQKKETFRLQLVNLSPIHSRNLYLQAGTFGQHHFQEIAIDEKTQSIDDKWLGIKLLPAATIELKIMLGRFVNRPSYDTPLKTRVDG